MSNLLSLVQYSDSDSESSSSNDKESSNVNKKRKLSSIIPKETSDSNAMRPPTKKLKTANTKLNKNESSESDDNDNDIIHNKKKKKIKLKGLSKVSSLLSKNKNKPIEFLSTPSNNDKTKQQIETEIFNKHNAKEIEKQKKKKEQIESIKQSISIKKQQKQVRNNLNKLSSSLNNDIIGNRKTVKEKEKAKRMKGQSSHHSWKSETFMLLRQQFD